LLIAPGPAGASQTTRGRAIWLGLGADVRWFTADAGWSSSVARWAHNPEVTGSNPVPATNEWPSQRRFPDNSEAASTALIGACGQFVGSSRRLVCRSQRSIPVDERGHRCSRGPSCGSRQNQVTSGVRPMRGLRTRGPGGYQAPWIETDVREEVWTVVIAWALVRSLCRCRPGRGGGRS
jgi:hypothetical protein